MLRTLTNRTNTAHIVRNTRIHAMPFETCLIIRTIRVQNTFWPATFLRISSKVGQTRTNGSPIGDLAYCIQPAWTRHARILFGHRYRNRKTPDDRISC